MGKLVVECGILAGGGGELRLPLKVVPGKEVGGWGGVPRALELAVPIMGSALTTGCSNEGEVEWRRRVSDVGNLIVACVM